MISLSILQPLGDSRTDTPEIISKLNRADPMMVLKPTLNCPNDKTANRAIINSGSELDMASNVAPLTGRDRLKCLPIADELRVKYLPV